MPLPKKWDGVFYSKETCGDLLFDITPEEFIAFVSTRSMGDPPQFFLAGAYFDLVLNDCSERAAEYMAAAKTKWPDPRWEPVEKYAIAGKELLPEEGGHSPDLGFLFFNIIAHMWGAMTLHIVQSNPSLN